MRQRYKRGDRLRHMTLGDGTFITYATGNFGDTAMIDFGGTMGVKELILGFCGNKLRKIKRPKPRKTPMEIAEAKAWRAVERMSSAQPRRGKKGKR